MVLHVLLHPLVPNRYPRSTQAPPRDHHPHVNLLRTRRAVGVSGAEEWELKYWRSRRGVPLHLSWPLHGTSLAQ